MKRKSTHFCMLLMFLVMFLFLFECNTKPKELGGALFEVTDSVELRKLRLDTTIVLDNSTAADVAGCTCMPFSTYTVECDCGTKGKRKAKCTISKCVENGTQCSHVCETCIAICSY